MSWRRIGVVYLVVALVAGVLILVVAPIGSIWLRAYQLAREGASTTGWITAAEPTSHSEHRFQTVRYAYTVGGRTYAGTWKGASPGNPAFEQLMEGSPVLVYYLPEAPDVSLLGDAQSVLSSETAFIVVWALVAPALGAAVVCTLADRWRTQVLAP